jgi:two-component system, LuxR family, response regulator DctR
VEVHRARVFEKMDVRSAVELSNLLREQPSAQQSAQPGQRHK